MQNHWTSILGVELELWVSCFRTGCAYTPGSAFLDRVPSKRPQHHQRIIISRHPPHGHLPCSRLPGRRPSFRIQTARLPVFSGTFGQNPSYGAEPSLGPSKHHPSNYASLLQGLLRTFARSSLSLPILGFSLLVQVLNNVIRFSY
jgi:hypothetical protein